MSKKSAQAPAQNTSATANPGTAADVSAAGVAPATSQAIAPPVVEGGTSVASDQGTIPLAGAGDGEIIGDPLPPKDSDLPLDFEIATFTNRISSRSPKGFYRAGLFWPVVGVDVMRADFSDDQWAALEEEPKLSIKTL